MQGFSSIINTILTLGLAMLVGFVCVRTKYISREVRDSLSQLIVRLTLPILVVTSLTKNSLTHEKIIGGLAVIICAWIVIGVLFALGALAAKLFRFKAERAVMHACMTAFGNVVFVAYPLIQALYGDEGLLYAALFAFANDCWLWTVGVYKMSSVRSKNASFGANLKKLINPSTIAFLISLFMMLTGLKFTGVIGDVLNGIGSTTTYSSMLVVGGLLADVDFGEIYKRLPLLAVTLVKMLLVPFLLILVLRFVPVADTVKSVIVFQAGMPSSTVVVLLAAKYECDMRYSAEGVFVTTLLSLVTLPVLYFLMHMLLF